MYDLDMSIQGVNCAGCGILTTSGSTINQEPFCARCAKGLDDTFESLIERKLDIEWIRRELRRERS